MRAVDKQTKTLYLKFTQETDPEKKAELKQAYADKVKELTLGSKAYRNIVDMFCDALAEANQEGLNVANDAMAYVYVENYNQVAVDCRKAGIKVAKSQDN